MGGGSPGKPTSGGTRSSSHPGLGFDPVPLSTKGGVQPRFAKDGKTLYFIDADRTWVQAVDLLPNETPPFSSLRRVFPLPEGTVYAQEVAYDTLPGGGFLFAIATQPLRHRLIFNWLDDVDKRLSEAD